MFPPLSGGEHKTISFSAIEVEPSIKTVENKELSHLVYINQLFELVFFLPTIYTFNRFN
jgi:hypothetical protein